MKVRKLPRRDLCYVLGRHASKLTEHQAYVAWTMLGLRLEQLGDADMPKFQDLYAAIRAAMKEARTAE